MKSGKVEPAQRVPIGVTMLAIFFGFGALMSGLASLALLFPDGALEPMWSVNPEARIGLVSLGLFGVGLMAAVSVACAAAACGLWSLTGWGYRLALALLGANIVGDAVNAIVRHDPRTLIGVPIGGLLVGYLLQPHIRVRFGGK